TEFRVLLVYLRLFVAPFGLTLDYDIPISKSLLDHGAVFALVPLLAITVMAWIWRRRFPLAAYGWFAFLILMAPTSSIGPIKDPIAERRLYLGMLGLLLIALEALRRTQLSRGTLATLLGAVALVGLVLTWSRADVWSSGVALWQDTIQKSPNKVRPHFQLA